MGNPSALVQKLWNYCKVLRDDGHAKGTSQNAEGRSLDMSTPSALVQKLWTRYSILRDDSLSYSMAEVGRRLSKAKSSGARRSGALKRMGLSLLFLLLPVAIHAAEFQIQSNTVVVLAGGEAARKAIATEDDFVRGLSEFDRASRLKSDQPVSREQFLKFIQGQVTDWSEQDTARMEMAVAGARDKLARFKLRLPERVLLVQTTGKEEANSAYCRGTNVIVMSRHFVNAPAAELETVVIHEMFHLLSRNNPELRTELYALIGFKPCNEIALPAELASRHISNPDAPRLDFRIEVSRGEKKHSAIPVLYATPERWTKEKGGEFFHYLTWRLMAVEDLDGSWRVMRSGGKPVLLSSSEVTDFHQQVGEQPGPVLQAEEILAEYFVKAVQRRGKLPPQVLAGFRRLLTP